jgi:ABC-type transport system involved in cytochrome c biogenesis permease subunit
MRTFLLLSISIHSTLHDIERIGLPFGNASDLIFFYFVRILTLKKYFQNRYRTPQFPLFPNHKETAILGIKLGCTSFFSMYPILTNTLP